VVPLNTLKLESSKDDGVESILLRVAPRLLCVFSEEGETPEGVRALESVPTPDEAVGNSTLEVVCCVRKGVREGKSTVGELMGVISGVYEVLRLEFREKL